MTDTTPFTIDDLDVLQDALVAWENKDIAGQMMGQLLVGALGKSHPELEAKQQQQEREAAVEKRRRKERSILLQAKLIGLKDALRAEHLVGGGKPAP